MAGRPPRQAGELDRLCTLRRPGETQGTTGEETGAATPFARNVPCKREPLAGNEAVAAQQVVADATFEVWIRYRGGIDEEMDAVFDDGLVLNVGAVLPVGRNEWLRILCSRPRP